ncbi:MAG: ACT domain-containing protein [Limisphaerales bacterium]
MNTVKLVAIFAENRPGQVARITEVLAHANINIRCIIVASTGNCGVMKVLVNDPDVACRELKEAGFAATLTDVVAVEMPDKPGALHSVAQCLAAHDINLLNTSGFAANNRAILVIEVEDPAQAGEVLKKNGLHVLTQKETLSI